jgi:hypothetical protein
VNHLVAAHVAHVRLGGLVGTTAPVFHGPAILPALRPARGSAAPGEPPRPIHAAPASARLDVNNLEQYVRPRWARSRHSGGL